jgi:ATP-dependent RNA helicase SUPV3L1/SUV3
MEIRYLGDEHGLNSPAGRARVKVAMGDTKVTAVLGPTNTGKTFLAVERMLGHRTGMIGFPLRLLARENYERIASAKGASQVALVTGEERIVPPYARWFVCTVEAMPIEREVGFLAVDEIQMIADRERGHVFVDRLLHARGRNETMFMGAESARPLIRRLVPEAEFVVRPRLSTLTYAGPRKITRLPRRSAIVAFSAAEVYEIAELVRRQRGGAALVFGALSPRTRNAQVAMYQSGDVDYLIATDAIGMGLNMDIDHVAFAATAKFDGRHLRRLAAPELGQIAGRAGRSMTNGTFGTTADVGPLDADLVEAIEEHRFPPLTHCYWRNSDLDFRTLDGLLETLDRRAPLAELVRVRDADDHLALQALARDADIRALSRGRVGLLWEVARIPDFRKQMADTHPRLLAKIFGHLAGPAGRLPQDWVDRQIERIDSAGGDIDKLLQQIAAIRTWTYVSHRPDWIADAEGVQARARAVEDRLSDALHERLTQRFVDRRNAVIVRKLADGSELLAAVTAAGDVLVEGMPAGKLDGFEFRPDPSLDMCVAALRAAANRALRRDVGLRVQKFVADDDAAFSLLPDARIAWTGQPVARLAAGPEALAPEIQLARADLLEPAHRQAVSRRLAEWLQAWLKQNMAPLLRLKTAPLPAAARGLAFELAASLGAIAAADTTIALDSLDRKARGSLAACGVHVGVRAAYVPALKDHESTKLRALLWSVHRGVPGSPPPPGMLSVPRGEAPPGLMAACLYLPAGPLFVRADRLEKLAQALLQSGRHGPFALEPAWAKLLDCDAAALPAVVASLGYRRVPGAGAPIFAAYRGGAARRRPKSAPGDAASPFSVLSEIARK